jgi:cell wall-associated NlpC family hydrolase
MGTAVSDGQRQPGDLVFFGSPVHHVGIYVGGGKMINSPYSGASVRIEAVWGNDYAGARRIID